MFKKILYPIDVQEGDVCRKCLAQVLDAARDWKAELLLIYVVPGFGMPLVASYFPEGAAKAILADAKGAMQNYIKANIPEDIRVTPVVCQGTPYEEILREAEERKVDVIVIPSRDRAELDKWLLGSTASKVVHHAGCAVLVLRTKASA